MKQTISDIVKFSELLKTEKKNQAEVVRQPVHVVYGGANLYTRKTPRKLGDIALQTLEKYLPNAASFAEVLGFREETAQKIYRKVLEKLTV